MGQVLYNPVYQQLYKTLRLLILEGDYAEGDRFLPERKIASRYEVSRVTASKAITQLVSEGILDVRQGAGTFICKTVLDYDLRQLVSFTKQAQAAGKTPKTTVLQFNKTTVAECCTEVQSKLNIDPDDKLFYTERLRLADDIPVIYERRWIVAEYCQELTKTDVNGSLYSVWIDKFDLEIVGADEVIRAVNLSSQQADLLDVLPQTAALMVSAKGFTTNNRLLWWEETLYRNDVYEFFNRVDGLKATRPAIGQFSKQ